jgi:hypothetical protein
MKDTPTLQVLDWGHPPLVHSRPKRLTVVLVSAALALLLSSVWVFYKGRSGDSLPLEQEVTDAGIAAMLRDDLRWIRGLLSGRADDPGS